MKLVGTIGRSTMLRAGRVSGAVGEKMTVLGDGGRDPSLVSWDCEEGFVPEGLERREDLVVVL